MNRIPFTKANNWTEVAYPTGDVQWRAADQNDDFIQFECTHKGERWAIRMNDFPDEPLYTLLVEGTEVIHFDDWPKFWLRPPFRQEQGQITSACT